MPGMCDICNMFFADLEGHVAERHGSPAASAYGAPPYMYYAPMGPYGYTPYGQQVVYQSQPPMSVPYGYYQKPSSAPSAASAASSPAHPSPAPHAVAHPPPRPPRPRRPEMPNVGRLNLRELRGLLPTILGYVAKNPADSVVRDYWHTMQREINRRQGVRVRALMRREDFGKIPLPTEPDIDGAMYILYVLRKAGATETSVAIAVGSTADGRLHVAVSGEDAKVARVEAVLNQYLGDIFTVHSPRNLSLMAAQMASVMMLGKGHVKVCAEPKLYQTRQAFVGMTTIWAGSDANPWALGSADGAVMLPCLDCKRASNADML